MAIPLPQSGSPLSEAHHKVLTDTLASCAKTRELLQKLKNAGMPLPDMEAQNDQHIAICQGLKKEFFPHLP